MKRLVRIRLTAPIKSLSAVLVEGLYLFVTVPPHQRPPILMPRMIFEEAEGTTLILLKSEAESHALPYEFPCRMITLNIHSSLEAVGFMARIASELAKYDMGVNPVSGFFPRSPVCPRWLRARCYEGSAEDVTKLNAANDRSEPTSTCFVSILTQLETGCICAITP